MNDDADVSVIQGLFGVGVALAIAALLAFSDGEFTVGLVAVALPLAALIGVGVYTIARRRQQTARRPSVAGQPTASPSPESAGRTTI